MTDEAFDRRLERDLREWTDSTARNHNWSEEARGLVSSATSADGRSRPRLIALGAAAVVLAAAAGIVLLDLAPFAGEPVGSASAQPSATSASPAPTGTAEPEPSTLAGNQLDLSRIAWWDAQSFGFGFFEDPGPTAPATPPTIKQVRIGTLDGRITAVLALSDAWGRSYVSGPVGTDVLVVNDDGKSSDISVISALDGSVRSSTSTDAIVPAAALSRGGEIFFVQINRATGIDFGLWRRSSAGDETQILAGPLGSEPVDQSIWQLAISPDGQTIVVQSCLGAVRCASYFVDAATGAARKIDSISWPRGVTDDELITRIADPGGSGLVAVNLVTLEIRPLLPDQQEAMPVRIGDRWNLAYGTGPEGLGPTWLFGLEDGSQMPVPGEGTDPPGSAVHSLGDRYGIGLPDGWVIRGPDPSVGTYGSPNAADRGSRQLINVATGERVAVDAMEWVVTNPACASIAPAEMPDGRGPGPHIDTLQAGVVYSQWGAGNGAVLEGVGLSTFEASALGQPRIRGLLGAVFELGESGIQLLAWEENGCPYTVWLPRGMTVAEAREYASRF